MNRAKISAGQLFLIGVSLLCFCQLGKAMETVTMGENGTLDWQGNGSSSVEAIDPPYRSLLNPNQLLVGNAPGDLVEFASPYFPGGIHPLFLQDSTNVANSALKRGGSITAPNVFGTGCVPACLDAQDIRFMLEELITLDDGGEKKAFEFIKSKFNKINNPNIKLKYDLANFAKNSKLYEISIKYYSD